MNVPARGFRHILQRSSSLLGCFCRLFVTSSVQTRTIFRFSFAATESSCFLAAKDAIRIILNDIAEFGSRIAFRTMHGSVLRSRWHARRSFTALVVALVGFCALLWWQVAEARAPLVGGHGSPGLYQSPQLPGGLLPPPGTGGAAGWDRRARGQLALRDGVRVHASGRPREAPPHASLATDGVRVPPSDEFAICNFSGNPQQRYLFPLSRAPSLSSCLTSLIDR